MYSETKDYKYYEDFINSPIGAFFELIEIMHEKNTRNRLNSGVANDLISKEEMINNLNDLMQNLNYHRGICLQRYTENLGLALSYGKKDPHFYSSQYDKEFLIKLRNAVKENIDTKLYKKYLSKYERL